VADLLQRARPAISCPGKIGFAKPLHILDRPAAFKAEDVARARREPETGPVGRDLFVVFPERLIFSSGGWFAHGAIVPLHVASTVPPETSSDPAKLGSHDPTEI
jgi:hypothetical protein